MSETDPLEITARVNAILNRRPAVGLAIGVVRNGSLEYFHAHGVADVDSRAPITEDTVFRIASITKTVTAIAVLQLWEQGLIDLDAPAADYLRAYRLVPAKAFFRPATVRHLLTHTSGIPEVVHPSDLLRRLFGETVPAGAPVPALTEYYRGRLRIQSEPGTRFVYTDHGFATLGQIVEDISREPLDRYFREHIFQPLGMTDTDLVRSTRIKDRLATGYTLGPHGPRRVADYEMVPAAASSVYSTPSDMARYLAALLGGGANEFGQVLKPATLATMFEPHYQPDPRIPGIGLGFWRGTTGGHAIVEHGGILPGFNSQIFVAPDAGLAVMAFTNGARAAMLWLPGETAGLLNHLLGVPSEAIRTDIPHRPEIWPELCGRYQLPARLTDARAREMVGAGVEVFTRGDQLRLRVLTPIPTLYRGLALHPDDPTDPYAYRIDLTRYGIGTARILFTPNKVHLDLLPLTLHKRPPATTPRLWALATLATLATRWHRRHRPCRTTDVPV
ncbi:serine hydrolase domain-containing protein [Actinophytocola sp.]|uniref:serine hydrolase domain-containing protein n=1 Tax=Actinophytocola sp. TaxID=1872138 RepID=UPI002D7EFFC3|nr:serine hydrolase domain-containing protein [Actinophytocola sp.]HET9140759.1 serine hydrolase domain-containing protein [Actinophytocola sp.]